MESFSNKKSGLNRQMELASKSGLDLLLRLIWINLSKSELDLSKRLTRIFLSKSDLD